MCETTTYKENKEGSNSVMKHLGNEFVKAVKFYFSPLIALSKDFSIESLKRDYRKSPTILGLPPLYEDGEGKPGKPKP